MNIFNKTLASLLFASIIFFLFYLAGSFGQSTFFISKWNPETRGIIATTGLMVSVVIGIIVFCNCDDIFKSNNTKKGF